MSRPGRSDAAIVSEFSVSAPKKAHPELTVLAGPPLFVDYNSYFLPYNDFEMQAWVDNWLSYQISHGTLAAMWNKWVAPDAKALGLTTTPVSSPYLKA
jgi:polar amino acid transport system substrate-binding protein